MKVALSYNPSTDGLIIFSAEPGPRSVYEDAKDAGFTFERRDLSTEEVVGYEFYALTTYHRQNGQWDLVIDEPDERFVVVDGPDIEMRLLELLDWAVENLDKISIRPAATAD